MCVCMCICKEDSGEEESDECKCWDQRLLMEKAVDGVKASHSSDETPDSLLD